MDQHTQSARQPNSKHCCLNWVWSTITANTAGLIFADHWARKISNAIKYQQNMRGASNEIRSHPYWRAELVQQLENVREMERNVELPTLEELCAELNDN